MIGNIFLEKGPVQCPAVMVVKLMELQDQLIQPSPTPQNWLSRTTTRSPNEKIAGGNGTFFEWRYNRQK